MLLPKDVLGLHVCHIDYITRLVYQFNGVIRTCFSSPRPNPFATVMKLEYLLTKFAVTWLLWERCVPNFCARNWRFSGWANLTVLAKYIRQTGRPIGLCSDTKIVTIYVKLFPSVVQGRMTIGLGIATYSICIFLLHVFRKYRPYG